MKDHAPTRGVCPDALFRQPPRVAIRLERTHLTTIESLALNAQRHHRVCTFQRLRQ
jgi:hypothetical protein